MKNCFACDHDAHSGPDAPSTCQHRNDLGSCDCMCEQRNALAELAAEYGTDKLQHGYCPFYERHFADLRDEPVALLEVGVWEGASLRMWRDWFTSGLIYGVEIDPTRQFTEDRIQTVQHDARYPITDESWPFSNTRTFDVIVDDGSHMSGDIVLALAWLWPRLVEGGWYVIEDWATQFGVHGPGYMSSPAEAGAREVMHRMIDAAVCQANPARPSLEGRPILITEVHVYDELVFFRK